MKKILSVLLTGVMVASLLVGCGNNKPTVGTSGNTRTLKLAHNLNETHPVHKSIVEFSKKVEEKSNGQLKVEIYSNGVLGGEREVIEQLQNGAVDMTKVSAGALEAFAPVYSTFGLPYLFRDADHYYKAMNSEVIKKVYQSTKDKGFVGVTYYDSGARSFYTKNKAIKTPADLKGLKIRVMNSETAIKMVKLLGGTPTPMPYGEIYTAIQQGIVDGAESNETVLTTGKHGEVAKEFTVNEHTRVPDILIMSQKTMESLTPEEQKIVQEAADESSKFHINIWNEEIKKAKETAEKNMKVNFTYPDKNEFKKLVQPLVEEFKKDSAKKEVIDAIEAIK